MSSQRVARLPFGDVAAGELLFSSATVDEVNPLLATEHYLGPIGAGAFCFSGWVDDELVAAMVWRLPTARLLPSDGTWLELSRWCLTPDAGKNAGSKMMAWARRTLRRVAPSVTTGVSYSDPSAGHSGALYRASGWQYAPTHHVLRWREDGVGYPSGNGSWDGFNLQHPKDRWLYFFVRSAARRPLPDPKTGPA